MNEEAGAEGAEPLDLHAQVAAIRTLLTGIQAALEDAKAMLREITG